MAMSRIKSRPKYHIDAHQAQAPSPAPHFPSLGHATHIIQVN